MGKTATEDILEYMRKNKDGISNNIAKDLFGVTRLSSIIFCLRKQGYVIDTKMEECVTRYGRKKDFAKYILISEKEKKDVE